ncbi:PqqD family protein [Sphingomonas lutea]|uniref:PqqD family protein n=1 Tax=Sphingomonas lutea TaxID=1045317 RepID=A0A7G9SEU1_9SPHN|nr:PqqD family protein [Sphingomonas lutea]QNN66366.1 PqqD family protein [Sphingomonas lutea]
MTDILDQAWQPSPDAFANAVGNELVLLQIKRGTYYGMDPLASRIWKGMNEGQSVRQICSNIAREYDAPLAQVEEDTRRFLEDLRTNEIIIAA